MHTTDSPPFIDYISYIPDMKNKPNSISKKSNFFTIAKKGILPKTGISENTASEFDKHFYAEK